LSHSNRHQLGEVALDAVRSIDLGLQLPFILKTWRSGKTLHVPDDKTVAEVLNENGVEVPLSCEQGICGTCLTGVVEGIPDHRDLFLTDEEKASNMLMTPCCSRSSTEVLVLDL